MRSVIQQRWLLLALAACLLVPAGFVAEQTSVAQQATPKAKAKTKAAPKTPSTAPATGAQPATSAKPSTTPPAAATPAEPADASKPAQAEYKRVFEEWKIILKDLRKLKVQYDAAAPADQQKIVDEWNAQIAKGNELLPTLQAAGVKAYEESPNTDPDLGRFLVKLAHDHIQRDEYPESKAITDVLIANECPDKSIYGAAAVSSFVLNDFEKADEYFKVAAESGELSDYGKDLVASVSEYKKLWEDEQKIREAESAKDDLPRVKLTTTKGDIVIELFEDQAPDTVGNFISLIEKKDESGKGFYDGLSFHRVLPNFMAQGGDPKGDGTGGPGYTIKCECYKEDYRRHFAGTLSMAHAGRDTGGSQFFLTFRPTPHLNGKHTAFGRVIEGMSVLPKLQRRNPEDAAPPEPDKIIKAEVLRKRDHAYVPRKVE